MPDLLNTAGEDGRRGSRTRALSHDSVIHEEPAHGRPDLSLVNTRERHVTQERRRHAAGLDVAGEAVGQRVPELNGDNAASGDRRGHGT